MSKPSIQAVFQSCHPLRRCTPRVRTQFFTRTFYSTRSCLLAEQPGNPPRISPAPSISSSSNEPSTESNSTISPSAPSPSDGNTPKDEPGLRLPRAVQASYLKPLRHPPTHGVPVCTLQLRSYSVRNLEFMGDFAMRAAYYLGLPAKGPSPLPRLVRRWTVLRSPFVNKKSQENFERITMRRLVEVQDGDAEVVKIWLAYLRRYAFYGVGMKANVWQFEGLDVAQDMDKAYAGIEKELDAKLSSFGWKSSVADQKSVPELLRSRGQRLPGMPMSEVGGLSKSSKQPHLTEDVYR